jgi:gluconolactonase
MTRRPLLPAAWALLAALAAAHAIRPAGTEAEAGATASPSPASTATSATASRPVLAPGAEVKLLAGGFRFTEGPAADAEGNVYFTDIRPNRILKWSPGRGVTVFRKPADGANGLAVDASGNVLACEADTGRVAAIAPDGKVTVLAAQYEGKRFNEPNDLWIDPAGGVYFTDPVYGRDIELVQNGEHVYYISPDRRKVTLVADDLVRPNGVIGTPDGRTLYVADHGAGKVYRYAIGEGGTLTDKKLFAPVASDGMAVDESNNVYLTAGAVLVYSPAGRRIGRIDVPRRPANVCFAGGDRRLLFITARSSIYGVRTAAAGAPTAATPPPATRPADAKKQARP